MDVSHEQIAALLHLQKVDLELMRQRKQLDELPQRGLILAAREKRSAIAERQSQVAGLRRDTVKKITRITDEDASLVKKQQGVQAAIEAAQGNYRNVEARTKELNGIAKRRAVLSEDLDKVTAELSKIDDLDAQIALALEDVIAKEEAAIASFQKEGGALKLGIMRLEEERKGLMCVLTAESIRAYEKAATRGGGVALGKLDGTRCGACRTVLDGGRLIDLKAQAPLGTCPNCKRLLIIED